MKLVKFLVALFSVHSLAHVLLVAAQLSISQTPAKLLNEYTLPFKTTTDHVVDANGNRVKFACVNWYGAHMELYAVDGLQVQNITTIVSRIVELGFNCVRLPFSLQGIVENPVVPETVLTANLNFINLTHLELLDITIQELASQNIMVVLNNHNTRAGWCCDVNSEEGLWTTSLYSTDEWINVLEQVALRYRNFSNVIAFDLRNEIHDVGDKTITWGESSDKNTDWKVASQLAGNRILEANPEMLIIVTGICFGFHISLLQQDPPNLIVNDRLIFTTHTYGFSTWWRIVEDFIIEFGLNSWNDVENFCKTLFVIAVIALVIAPVPFVFKPVVIGSMLRNMTRATILVTVSSWSILFFMIMLACSLLWREAMKQGGCTGMHAGPDSLFRSSISFLIIFSFLLAYGISRNCMKEKTSLVDGVATKAQGVEDDISKDKLDKSSNEEKEIPGTQSRSSVGCILLNYIFFWAFVAGFSSFVWVISAMTQDYRMVKWNLDGAWVTDDTIAPIWLGEFGNDKPDDWFRHLVRYLDEKDLDWAYWALNGLKWNQDIPDWEDEGYGLLLPDYNISRQPELMALLQTIQQSNSP